MKQPFRTFAHVGQKSIPSTADWIHVVALASWHLRSTAPLGLPYGLNGIAPIYKEMTDSYTQG